MGHIPVRRICILFIVAFVLNFLWEEAHHVLYVTYQGGEITHFILLRAALFDAAVTALLFGPLLFVVHGRLFLPIPVFLAVVCAVGLEMYALSTGRWVYQPSMPLIPFFHVGLTPTVQLAVLGAIAFRLSWRSSLRATS